MEQSERDTGSGDLEERYSHVILGRESPGGKARL